MTSDAHPAPSAGQTGGLPGDNAHHSTIRISEDEKADTVSMGGTGSGTDSGSGEPDEGYAASNG